MDQITAAAEAFKDEFPEANPEDIANLVHRYIDAVDNAAVEIFRDLSNEYKFQKGL